MSAHPFGRPPRRPLKPWELGEGQAPLGVRLIAGLLVGLIIIAMIGGVLFGLMAGRS